MWYSGIDWADDHHDVLVIDEKGHKRGSLRVSHTKAGLSKLNTFLEQIIGTASKEEMACIIETTHGLLIAHLLEEGWPVYPVNPRTVDRRRAASGAKTDTIDAYLLAKTGRADLADLHRLIPDPRPGQLDPDANPSGQSTDGLSQSLLPSGSGAVWETAPEEHFAVPAHLPHPTSGDGRFGTTDPGGPASSETSSRP